MHVLTFALQKGGVGKTSTTLAIGVELARQGLRVLLVDMDPQSNLTTAIGVDQSQLPRSIYDVLLAPDDGVSGVIVDTPYGVALAPAKLVLAGAEMMLVNQVGRELVLRSALSSVQDHYDLCLIDTPPSLGVLTINALCAAHDVIVPLQAHALALHAIPQLEDTIKRVRILNPALKLTGIVVTMVDRRTTVSRQVEEEARRVYGDLVFATTIPQATRMIEAPAAGQPIGMYAPDSAAAIAYRDLAQEFINRYAS